MILNNISSLIICALNQEIAVKTTLVFIIYITQVMAIHFACALLFLPEYKTRLRPRILKRASSITYRYISIYIFVLNILLYALVNKKQTYAFIIIVLNFNYFYTDTFLITINKLIHWYLKINTFLNFVLSIK